MASSTPSPTTTLMPSSSAVITRRFPPPCWSPEETEALIEVYHEKWYSLHRGNLKAPHWQQVADAVAGRCPGAVPLKTALQCRHKMEKLRKRYRTEVQRARSVAVSRFKLGWVHFGRMDEMENGIQVEDEDDEGLSGGLSVRNGNVIMRRSIHKLYGNGAMAGVGIGVGTGGSSCGGGRFRKKIPTGVIVAQPGRRFYGTVDDRNDRSEFNLGPPNGRVVGESNVRQMFLKREREGERRMEAKEKDPVEEMVGAIKMLGDGLVRVEKMKMDMAKEIETMQMEMEMKRTRMILDSQHRIVQAFANAVGEKKAKKVKIIPSA